MYRGCGRNGRREGESAQGEGTSGSLMFRVVSLLPSLVPADPPAEEQRLYNQLVVDTHVFMVREVERRLLLEGVVSSDRCALSQTLYSIIYVLFSIHPHDVTYTHAHTHSEEGVECSCSGRRTRRQDHEQPVLLSPGEFYSSTASSSDGETAKSTRKRAVRKKKKKRPWDQQLPLTQKEMECVQRSNRRLRAKRRRKRNPSESLSSGAGEEEERESDKERDGDSSGGWAARGSGRSWSSGGEMKQERSSSEEEGGSEGSDVGELGEGGRRDEGMKSEEHGKREGGESSGEEMTPNKARSITLHSRTVVLSTIQDDAESDSTGPRTV